MKIMKDMKRSRLRTNPYFMLFMCFMTFMLTL